MNEPQSGTITFGLPPVFGHIFLHFVALHQSSRSDQPGLEQLQKYPAQMTGAGVYKQQIDNKIRTQTQCPRHGEKPGINMTQATTTTVLKIQQMYGILHHQQT